MQKCVVFGVGGVTFYCAPESGPLDWEDEGIVMIDQLSGLTSVRYVYVYAADLVQDEKCSGDLFCLEEFASALSSNDWNTVLAGEEEIEMNLVNCHIGSLAALRDTPFSRLT